VNVTTGPSVLTVILNFRTPELTLKALQAALVAMEGLDGAISVVDNDSGDGSYEKLQAAVQAAGWPRVRVLRAEHNGGYGAGNNFGIRQGLPDGRKPDYIYILNSDAFPEPAAIRALLNYMETHPDAGLAGSRVYGEHGDHHNTAFRFPTVFSEFESSAVTGPISRLLKRYIVAMPPPQAAQPVDWCAGASLMLRQRVFDETNGFDEAFFLYFEETDLCLRALRAGWKTIYVPESRVMHIGSVSTGMKTWRRIPPYWYESRWRFFTKNHGTTYAVTATLAQLIGTLILRLRRLIDRRPYAGPEHFLADLLAHDWRALWQKQRPPQATSGATS